MSCAVQHGRNLWHKIPYEIDSKFFFELLLRVYFLSIRRHAPVTLMRMAITSSLTP